jgi:hypothetical protein
MQRQVEEMSSSRVSVKANGKPATPLGNPEERPLLG